MWVLVISQADPHTSSGNSLQPGRSPNISPGTSSRHTTPVQYVLCRPCWLNTLGRTCNWPSYVLPTCESQSHAALYQSNHCRCHRWSIWSVGHNKEGNEKMKRDIVRMRQNIMYNITGRKARWRTLKINNRRGASMEMSRGKEKKLRKLKGMESHTWAYF